jgi:hypothetical protein
MGNLVCLEELVLDPVEGRSETDDLVVQLGKLTRLRVLHIKFDKEMEESSQNALVNSLCSLDILQDIKIDCPISVKASTAWQGWVPPRQLWRLIIQNIMFSHFPAWINLWRYVLCKSRTWRTLRDCQSYAISVQAASLSSSMGWSKHVFLPLS